MIMGKDIISSRKIICPCGNVVIYYIKVIILNRFLLYMLKSFN